MEFYFAFLIKLVVIFIGGGLVSLLAFWITKRTSTIPSQVIDSYISRAENKSQLLARCEKISSCSGIYEVFVSGSPAIRLFSSHKGMKIV